MDDFEMVEYYENNVLNPYMKKHKCSKEEAIRQTYYKTKDIKK